VGQLEHPNIVPVHDVGVDADGRYYFVMKHIEGESLESVIDTLKRGDPAAHARFSFAARGQLVVSVLNALTYAHQRGFVHRDLKPSNVMVGPYGEVTIVDWGLAKRMHLGRAPALVEGCARLPRQNGAVSPMGPPTETYASVARGAKETIDGEVMGTPAYMAPEQARGQHSACDERTDLYAVGTVLYELMHLQHPLEAQLSLPLPHLLEAVQHQAPPFHAAPTFQPAQSTVPAEMDWFLKTALQKDPAKRFQTAEEMAARLRGLLEGRFPVQCHRTLAKRVLSEGAACIDRYPRAFIIGSTAVVAVLLGGLVNALL
jgi:serine/threonine-protein kinase